MDEYGNYYLVLEDKTTGDRKYMDFQGKQNFMPKEYTIRTNVPLAAIDELTSNFVNEDHMRLSITKEDDRGEHNSAIYITYQNQGERRLNCVYDDETLAHIASKTKGAKKGLLDLNDPVTNNTLYAIFLEIERFGSTLSADILNGSLNSYSINNHNAELVRELHRNPPRKESENYKIFRSRFAKDNAFGNYKEFRALYLNYKAYKEEKRKENERLLKGIIPSNEEKEYTPSDPTVELQYESSPIEEKKEEEGKKPMQLDMFNMYGDVFRR